jgi:peptidoglycan hydrolase-like protein with peptidoglycan-binding domain
MIPLKTVRVDAWRCDMGLVRRLTTVFFSVLLSLTLALSALAEDYHVLSNGSSDGEGVFSVYSLQQRLIELGFLTGSPDGKFGAGTETAVRAFQSANGLDATGIATVETQELLFSDLSSTNATAAPSETAASQVITTGSTGNDVYILQSYMFLWGFSVDEPDGKFGTGTRKALSEFMTYAYDDMVAYTKAGRAAATPAPTLEPTPTLAGAEGGMDEVIDVALTPEPTIPADGTVTAEWFDYIQSGFDPYTDTNLAVGSSGAAVKRMQRRLYALKYIAAGVDGGFGEHTEVALAYFQERNGLDATGVLDEATGKRLFSGSALSSDQYVSMYMAKVSIKDQRVYIYKWTGSGYTALVHTFVCSTGTKENPTITGTFQASGRNGEWYYFEESYVWARYAFVITGGYFFHSVLYNEKGGDPTSSSVRNLGSRASHGCIRLQVEDAKWIYDNCAAGMTVTIYDD